MNISAKLSLCFAVFFLCATSSVQAALTISTGPTVNVTCAKNICRARTAHAVLNISQLQSMLNRSDPKLVSGRVTGDIVVAAALIWPSAHTLTLDAYRSVIVSQPVTVAGAGGLNIFTNDGGSGGSFSFGRDANVTLMDLSSSLTINGATYTLVNSIASLVRGARDFYGQVPLGSNGHFALSGNYNAKADGIYSRAPVPYFSGVFEGLGNTISNFTIVDSDSSLPAGLFAVANPSAVIENLNLVDAKIASTTSAGAGAFVGENLGQLANDTVSGSVNGHASYSGGLASINFGIVTNSIANVTVAPECPRGSIAGGLVGSNDGIIRSSHASGIVTCTNNTAGGLVGFNLGGVINASYAVDSVEGREAGGLVGINVGAIVNSYARGKVSGETDATLGGLAGMSSHISYILGTIRSSYSVVEIKTGTTKVLGGFIGTEENAPGSNTNSYWDLPASGVPNASQAAGNLANDPGIRGLTTTQLQSGLPTGFDPSIWGENPSINDGLPYLLGNPPT